MRQRENYRTLCGPLHIINLLFLYLYNGPYAAQAL